ncbi:type II and III secretion system protein family protein [Dongshaea marina]|uniref:type II and III secretion system protein family protein n=1 Tax=Dongshaea marina TaxID=2047966 RepID=UPI000D3EC623|nr:pilus assembly protein N-terminal domain-containing protein [Dongshaea marina]
MFYRIAKSCLLLSVLLGSMAVQAQQLFIDQGGSLNLSFEQKVKTVFIANSAVADYKVINDHHLVLFGKKEGRSQITVYNPSGKAIYGRVLIVNRNISALRKVISDQYPDVQVRIRQINNKILLEGNVSDEGTHAAIANLAKQLLDKGLKLVDTLQVTNAPQVNIQLTIADVSKSLEHNIGVDWSDLSGSTGTFFFSNLTAPDLSALLNANSENKSSYVLAEPNMTVMSGKKAKFLAGGQIPIVTSSVNGQSVDYKDYGVQLNVGAVVKAHGKIDITVATEVSTLGAKTYNNYPTLDTRRASSVVQVKDGQSFVLGGLLSSGDAKDLNRVPLLGDIPVLGAFFRHAQNTTDKREMIVVATVHLVRPVQAGTVQLPSMQHTSVWHDLLGLPTSSTKNPLVQQSAIRNGGFIR